ncbi:MAG TPA: hypothetical protein VFT45_15865 [Longimicrobium sp.]|nr:hypothetical protein [Longimicrobium sp.]
MWTTSACRRRGFGFGLASLCLLGVPTAASAQDAASIFTTLGKFASGFNAGEVFIAPIGFVESDVLEEKGELQQIGLVLNNPNLGITVGFDLLTGFAAKEESLDLRGAITALPTVSTYYNVDLSNTVPVTGTLGLGIGLSQLQDVRATLGQAAGADRAIKVSGTGYHMGGTLLFGLSFGSAAVHVGSSIRYTRFPSLDWTEDKAFVPPAGWPVSMDFWTGTVRVGVAIGVRRQLDQ